MPISPPFPPKRDSFGSTRHLPVGHREGRGTGASLGLSCVNTGSPGLGAHSLALHSLGEIIALRELTDLEVSFQGTGYYLKLTPADG